MVIRDRAVREGAKDPTRHETPPIVVITHLGHLWGQKTQSGLMTGPLKWLCGC